MKKNRYSRALKHLKSKQLDEKLQRLNEAPANSIGGVYALNPPGFRVGIPDPPKVYYPDVDGNWPAGIPGTPGELSYTRPEGYWSGGSDWDEQVQTDFSQDYLLNDPTGTSTDALIAADGTVLAQLPPGGQNFILGPIVDGYVYNHGYDDYTNIGYLQKDTRQFVLLARIQGHWSSSLNPNGYTTRVWNGTAGQLTIYNQNFTLAMAEWVRDQIITSNNYTSNVPYFYSGGVPQIPQSPADCPNCPPGMYGGNGVGSKPFGKGGNPNIGTKQGNPTKGNPKDANLWGLNYKTGKKEKLSAKDYAAYKAGGGDAAAKKGKSIGEIIAKGKVNLSKEINPNIIARTARSATDPIRYSGTQMYQGNPRNRAPGLSNYWSPDPKTAGTYSRSGSLKGMPGAKPDPTGTFTTASRPQNIPRVSRSPLGQPQFKFEKGSPPPQAMITQVADDVAVKSAANGASKASRILGRAVPFVSIGISLVDAGVRASNGDYAGAILSGLSAIPGPIGWGALGVQIITDATGKTGGTRKESFDTYQQYLDIGKKVLTREKLPNNQNAYLSNFLRQFADEKRISDNDKSMLVAIIQGNTEDITSVDVIDFIKRIQKVLSENTNFIEEKCILNEDHRRILREIKQPVKVDELPKQKLEKYRPNFAGKYSPQNTPDVTASKKSNDMVQSKNAAGQTWRTNDKYWKGYETVERMNVIYDNVGHGSQYWDAIVSENLRKKGQRDREIQEQLNIIAHEKAMIQENPNYESPFKEALKEQETLQADKDPLFRKVKDKLKPVIDYSDKPSKLGYPNEAPPEIPTGWHPEYGEKGNYYNSLDPQSANSMPPTGNPEIDKKVQRAKKIKKIIGKKA